MMATRLRTTFATQKLGRSERAVSHVRVASCSSTIEQLKPFILGRSSALPACAVMFHLASASYIVAVEHRQNSTTRSVRADVVWSKAPYVVGFGGVATSFSVGDEQAVRNRKG